MPKRNKTFKTDNLQKNELVEKEQLPIKSYITELAKIELTETQKSLIKIIDKSEITIILGPAGTSKTFMGCYYSLRELANHKYDKVILTKPIQEAGEKLGALPGDVDEKIEPYFESYKGNYIKIIGQNKFNTLYEKRIIEFKPLAYMRGVNFDSSLMIGDEFQNTTWKQMLLFITRMGKNSKVIISGDTSQYDLDKNLSSLLTFSNMASTIKGINIFTFGREHIQRHPILIELTEKYEKLKYTGQIKEEK